MNLLLRTIVAQRGNSLNWPLSPNSHRPLPHSGNGFIELLKAHVIDVGPMPNRQFPPRTRHEPQNTRGRDRSSSHGGFGSGTISKLGQLQPGRSPWEEDRSLARAFYAPRLGLFGRRAGGPTIFSGPSRFSIR